VGCEPGCYAGGVEGVGAGEVGWRGEGRSGCDVFEADWAGCGGDGGGEGGESGEEC